MPKFGLIGHPIDHSRSPELFRSAYRGRWQYDLIQTDDFCVAWQRFLDEYQAINITAPFKKDAMARADVISDECLRIGAANIAVKTEKGIAVHNSDYLAVRHLLQRHCPVNAETTVAVIGSGGAGLAARVAAQDEILAAGGKEDNLRVYHHDEICGGLAADIVIYTLPKFAEGAQLIKCQVLIEANYKDPCLAGTDAKYISGAEWLRAQALTGYKLMTGEEILDF